MIEKLFREPQDGKPYQFVVFAGCFVLLVGAFLLAFSSVEPSVRLLALGEVVLGLGLVAGNTAELLPKRRTNLAASLRVFGVTSCALSAGIILTALWLMLG